MRRILRSVRDERIYGAVDTERIPPFEGAAGDVLGAYRRRFGDARTLKMVMADGWSNGYLYFADPAPS